MTINPFTLPYPDFADGDIVTAEIWNNEFNTISDYLNNQVKTAVDALQAGSSQQFAQVCNARMTLVQGQPFNLSDVPSSANLYIEPANGNQVGLYDTASGTWIPRTLASSTLSIAAPAATEDLYNAFLYWNGASIAALLSPYTSVVATNNPAQGYSVAINMNDTSAFTQGDVVSVSTGANSEFCVVLSINTNVSITVDWLSYNHTTPTVRSNKPTAALATQDGVLLMDSDRSKRFIGTVLVANSKFSDAGYGSAAGGGMRFVANQYNRIQKTLTHQFQGNQTVNNLACNPQSGAVSNKPLYNACNGGVMFVTTPLGTTFDYTRQEGVAGSNYAFAAFSASGNARVGSGITTQQPPLLAASIGTLQYGLLTTIGGQLNCSGILSRAGRQFIWDMVFNTSGASVSITRSVNTQYVANTTITIWC